jgi:threonine/homoserine/homoserine lactone efflux protein
MEQIYTIKILLSIVTFAATMLFTPGPNNIMLLSSGLTFGYKKTISHIFGVALGFAFMVVVVGLGLKNIFEQFPTIFTILKFASILYLFYLAYKIAISSGGFSTKTTIKPFSFFQAVIFQWVNPKAWIIAISSISIFVNSIENSTIQISILAFIFGVVGIISANSWTLGGVALKKIIKNKKHIHYFNILMAILLVFSVLMVVFE